VFAVTRKGDAARRNVKASCTNVRRSETHPQSAQRTPSTCAAREWVQYSQRFAFFSTVLVKNMIRA